APSSWVSRWRAASSRPLFTRLPANHSGVDARAGSRHRLEEQLVAVDFDEHERLVPIEVGGSHRGRPHVARAELAARPGDEVGDPLLRLEALVDVVVSGDDDV